MPRFPTDERSPAGLGGRFYGVYPAVVTDLQDPDSQGRVEVKLPWCPDPKGGAEGYTAWARIAMLMAGSNRGTWFIPDQDDEVLVAFEGGDPRRPFVLGMLWNGADSPPESADSNNYIKSITSRNGVKITIDDTDGAEKYKVETPGGHSMSMEDSGMKIEIKDSSSNTVKMEASGITVTASAQVKVEAGTVQVDAGSVTVNAGISTFSGVVKCDTLITNSVVSPSYTPGAGNVW
jgi:uncharacterized protein involved in type VI secretion and phage assembly